MLTGKRVLITGGTGSLGKVLVRRLLSGEMGKPERITVFSRDEAKQHGMRLQYQDRRTVTDEVIYGDFKNLLAFQIGDVRDFSSVAAALRNADVVFHAAALKQVPTCEYCPEEAVATNIRGAENIVKAIRTLDVPVETIIAVSTDKAVKPVNVMGMTKAIQERIFAAANIGCPRKRFIIVRYGNVMASRGSVIPLFHDQIEGGGPLTITSHEMTRFLLTLDDAVKAIFEALRSARPGETYVPLAPATKIIDVARALIGTRKIEIRTTGIRPGEKLHEILVSEEESARVTKRGDYYVIGPVLPELRDGRPPGPSALEGREYSSFDNLMTPDEVRDMLTNKQLMIGDVMRMDGEFLR